VTYGRRMTRTAISGLRHVVDPNGLPRRQRGNTPITVGVLDKAIGPAAVAAKLSEYQAVAITIESDSLRRPTPSGAQVTVIPV
jgi:hypothetical protein